jgi:acyl carrier protein
MGYLADGHFDENSERVVKFQGHGSATEAQVLALVEAAILRPVRTVQTCQVLFGMTGTGSLVQRDPRYAQPRQSIVRQRQQASQSSHASAREGVVAQKQKPLSEQIAGAGSSQEATECVTAALVAKVADMFALTPSAVSPADALKDLGVDSLVAVELRNWLTSNARADVSIFQLLDSRSLHDLAAAVVALKRGEVTKS